MKPEILEKLSNYTKEIQELLFILRKLIFEIAEANNLGKVEETLKWNEPSYSTKNGSPIRIDWKHKTPNQYYIFFNCNTKLVETFRLLYSNDLEFQGNRAIVLNTLEPLKKDIIEKCILMALDYRNLKNLPLLGQN